MNKRSVEKEADFECEVKLVCKRCGRELHTDGHFVRHNSGTVSFLVYNADKDCYWCKLEAEKEAKTQ